MDTALIAKALLYELQVATCNCEAGNNEFVGDLSHPDAHNAKCEYRNILDVMVASIDDVDMDDIRELSS